MRGRRRRLWTNRCGPTPRMGASWASCAGTRRRRHGGRRRCCRSSRWRSERQYSGGGLADDGLEVPDEVRLIGVAELDDDARPVEAVAVVQAGGNLVQAVALD